jgi:hypothetical protein
VEFVQPDKWVFWGPKVFLLTIIKPEYSDILYNLTHFPAPLVCRIRQVPMYIWKIYIKIKNIYAVLFRKRYNPLYDAMISTTPNTGIYNKVRETREKMLQTQIRLLRMIVIILIFISCTSLSLSLYLIISNSSGKKHFIYLT